MCIQHRGDNDFTSIKTCFLHCFVYTLVRNRPRKWIEDNTCPNAGAIFFILNENPTQCRGLADFVNPLPGGGILIRSLSRVTPPPPPRVGHLDIIFKRRDTKTPFLGPRNYPKYNSYASKNNHKI